jgi:methyl-accepting chemotaxis protein
MRNIFSHKLLKDAEYEALHGLIVQKDKIIEKATSFIKDVENGNLDTDQLNGVSTDSNTLANSLLSMRDKMKTISEDERKRNWVTQGLAQFVETLRVNNDDIKKLTEHIISSLVKYMEANQGALFILNEDNKKDRHLEMLACYAYNRKKYLSKRIELGEGMTGQAFLERNTVYLTEVPKDFVTITSGLGEALPRNVLIVPLKVNQEIYGIVELASFSPIQSHQIEFVEKLGESIASTISNVKTNQQTKRLLIETQQQAEQMRAQEEEMRQNMEELKATQEEVVRRQEEANKLLQKFELVTKTTTEGLWDLEIPKDNNIGDNTPFNWSDRFRQMVGYTNEKDFPNFLHSWSDLLHADDKQNTLNAFSEHLLDRSGKTPYDVEYQLKMKNGNYRWFRAVGNTVRDEQGNALRVAGSLIDIQGLKDIRALQLELEEKVRKRTEELQVVLASAQQKNEELKAQEEELRQNMEEMQATQETIARKQKEIDKAHAENERVRQVEAERASKVAEMQKKTMLASTMKLKKKVEELQQMKEELTAQEEELRQNMEEMQATHETMMRKQEEVDKAKFENERIKQEEAERALKVGEMQKKTMLAATLKLKSKVVELQRMKEEVDKVKEDEARRGLKISEIQKQAVNKLILRLKATESELRKVKSKSKTLQ